MQNYLVVLLCFFVAFVSIEARPWYESNYNGNGGGYGSNGYGNNGQRGNGQSSNGYGNSGQGGNGYGSNGQGSNGYGNNGQGSNGYGNNGRGSNGNSVSHTRSGSDRYVPRSCKDCKINSFGNGNNNRNKFDLPPSIFS